jgi:hypothetical protein
MACNETIRLANRDWPLNRTTESGLCCYVVVVGSVDDAAEVAADAETKPNYVRRSQFYDVPDNKIRFYLYFQPEGKSPRE